MTHQSFPVKITLVLLIAVCLSCNEKSSGGDETFTNLPNTLEI